MPRADGVSALVNTKALNMAGINRDTPDSEGGRVERDAWRGAHWVCLGEGDGALESHTAIGNRRLHNR